MLIKRKEKVVASKKVHAKMKSTGILEVSTIIEVVLVLAIAGLIFFDGIYCVSDFAAFAA